MTRKPIQITFTDDYCGWPLLVALADDGTLWRTRICGQHPTVEQWAELRPLPQGPEELGE